MRQPQRQTSACSLGGGIFEAAQRFQFNVLGAAASCSREPERANPSCGSLAAPRSSARRGGAGGGGRVGCARAWSSVRPARAFAPTLSSPGAAGGGTGVERAAASRPQAAAPACERVPALSALLRSRGSLTSSGTDPDTPRAGAVPPRSCPSDSTLIRCAPGVLHPHQANRAGCTEFPVALLPGVI